MSAKIIRRNQKSITIEVEIPITNSMLTGEELIQKALNQAGAEATGYLLSQFDTDGSAIKVSNETYSCKGKVPKAYQTPYGEITIERNVYQNNYGGKTYCPLEEEARVLVGSTPKFAKMVSSKYSNAGAKRVQNDLKDNHSRYISCSFIQDISEAVKETIKEKDEKWEYTIPIPKEDVKTISISLDGTCLLMAEGGYRQAMVGTISLYDKKGERLHTQYTSAPPEYGKSQFINEFTKEINHIKKLYPNKKSVGIADGAKDNWLFLEQHSQNQVLDYYHASEYLTIASENGFRKKDESKKWLDDACHTLKYEENGASDILKELKMFRKKKISPTKMDKIEKSITYFENHIHQMDYYTYQKKHFPIGSGVVEAACKVIIKQRLGNSGMKWKNNGAETVLCLRCFNYSDGKWGQLWDKISKYGI